MAVHVTNAPQKSNVELRVLFACFTIYVLKKRGVKIIVVFLPIFSTPKALFRF